MGEPRGTPPHAARPAEVPTRRQVLAATAGALAFPRGLLDDDPAATRPPNVLLVLSDSHRVQSLGCYGDEILRTPRLDGFAGQGVRLTSAVANTPVCRPYRASLMSGTWAHRHGMLLNTSPRNFGVDGRRQWNPHELPLLAEAFAAAGYSCAYVGKWHLGAGNIDADDPRRLGFDDGWAVAVNPVHAYDSWTFCSGSAPEQRISGGGRFRAAMELDQLLAVIEGLGEGPWFTVLSWGPPHDPLEPPPEFAWDPARRLPLPPNVKADQARHYARTELPGYYGLIEALDHEFGRLLDALTERDRDDTLVVYTSDHGNMMGSHDYLGKELPYHTSTGVPFLARWPGHIPAGLVVDTPFGAPDVFPTLCGLAGVPQPAGVDGFDHSRALLGDPGGPAAPEAAYLAGYDLPTLPWPGWRGLRTARHLYARKPDKAWMLHDLIEDPWQLRDLRKEDKALRKDLDALLVETMERVGDSWG